MVGSLQEVRYLHLQLLAPLHLDLVGEGCGQARSTLAVPAAACDFLAGHVGVAALRQVIDAALLPLEQVD